MKTKLIAAIMLVFLITGCAQNFYAGSIAESHMPFPNSNIKPMGKVVGQASSTSVGGVSFGSKLKTDAVEDALSKAPGSNILINYHVFYELSNFLFITTTTLRVEGTAAVQEIGEQELN